MPKTSQYPYPKKCLKHPNYPTHKSLKHPNPLTVLTVKGLSTFLVVFQLPTVAQMVYLFNNTALRPLQSHETVPLKMILVFPFIRSQYLETILYTSFLNGFPYNQFLDRFPLNQHLETVFLKSTS